MSVSAIILAAGQGERFGAKKQFIEYKGLPLWRHVYNRCLESYGFNKIVVVGIAKPPIGTRYATKVGNTVFIEKGGKTRQDSVFYGLHKVTSERVVILEAARPLITVDQIRAITQDTHDSTTFVAPAHETILYDGKHLDRNRCIMVQVPQAFNTHKLARAHIESGITNATDDTILMRQRWGIEPHLMLGGRNLYKVTYPHDLKVLEVIDESSNNGR